MAKLSDYDFYKMPQEVIDFKDAVTNILNYGKYSAPVLTSAPNWRGREGEHCYAYIANTGGETGYDFYTYFWINSGWIYMQWISATTNLYYQATSSIPVWNAVMDPIIALSDRAITGIKIALGAIGSDNMAINSIYTEALSARVVDTTKLGLGAVNSANIAIDSIYTAALSARIVDTTKLGLGAVNSANIAIDSIFTQALSTGAVTAVKIGSNAIIAGHLSANAVTATAIAANAIIAEKIAANAIIASHLSANAVTATAIAASAIIAEKIAVNAIIAGHLSANAVTATAISSGAVTTDKILANAITSAKIGAEQILAAHLTAGELVTLSAQIKDGIITNAKVGTMNANKITVGVLDGFYVTLSNLNANYITAGTILTTYLSAGTIAGNYIIQGNLSEGHVFSQITEVSRSAGSGTSWDKSIPDDIGFPIYKRAGMGIMRITVYLKASNNSTSGMRLKVDDDGANIIGNSVSVDPTNTYMVKTLSADVTSLTNNAWYYFKLECDLGDDSGRWAYMKNFGSFIQYGS